MFVCICMCVYTTYSYVDGYLGCFHVLAIVNCFVINIGVCVSFQIRVFVFSRQMFGSGIAGLYGCSISRFLKESPWDFEHSWFVEGESHSVVSNSLQSHGQYSPWNSPGQNTEVGSLFLLRWIFPTQELNWGLLYCRWIPYQLNYQGSPICCWP